MLVFQMRNVDKTSTVLKQTIIQKESRQKLSFLYSLFSRFYRSKRPVMYFVTITNCRIKNSQITEKHRTVYSFPTMRVFISAESYMKALTGQPFLAARYSFRGVLVRQPLSFCIITVIKCNSCG